MSATSELIVSKSEMVLGRKIQPKKDSKIYNSGRLLVVMHLTTSLPVYCLNGKFCCLPDAHHKYSSFYRIQFCYCCCCFWKWTENKPKTTPICDSFHALVTRNMSDLTATFIGVAVYGYHWSRPFGYHVLPDRPTTYVEHLQGIQARAARARCGTYKAMSRAVLDVETFLLPIEHQIWEHHADVITRMSLCKDTAEIAGFEPREQRWRVNLIASTYSRFYCRADW